MYSRDLDFSNFPNVWNKLLIQKSSSENKSYFFLVNGAPKGKRTFSGEVNY